MESPKHAMMCKNCKWNVMYITHTNWRVLIIENDDKTHHARPKKKKHPKVMEVLENAIMCDNYKSNMM